jgi:hypothetical protein
VQGIDVHIPTPLLLLLSHLNILVSSLLLLLDLSLPILVFPPSSYPFLSS